MIPRGLKRPYLLSAMLQQVDYMPIHIRVSIEHSLTIREENKIVSVKTRELVCPSMTEEIVYKIWTFFIVSYLLFYMTQSRLVHILRRMFMIALH